MSIALSWYGSYLFSIDTPTSRVVHNAEPVSRVQEDQGYGLFEAEAGGARVLTNDYLEGGNQFLNIDAPVFFLSPPPLFFFPLQRRTTCLPLVS